MPSALKCRDQRREHHPGESEIFFPTPRSRRWSHSPGGRTRSSRAARTCLWHSLPAITPSVPSPGPQTLRNSRQHTLPPQYILLTLPSPRQPSPNLVVPCTPTVAPLHSPQSLAFPTAALRGRGALSNAGHFCTRQLVHVPTWGELSPPRGLRHPDFLKVPGSENTSSGTSRRPKLRFLYKISG